MPEISIKAETLFRIGAFAVTNSLLLSLFVFSFFVGIFLRYHYESKSGNYSTLYYLINMILRALYTLFSSIVHDKITTFFPLLSGFFIWILVQNWSGLLPGVGSLTLRVPASVVHGIQNEATHVSEDEDITAKPAHEEKLAIPLFRGNNADINATLALALISVIMTQVYGVQFLGFKTYISKFLNFKDPIYFILGLLEVVSEVSKVISFAFRLFGNIFAGEVLLTIVAFLVPVLASFPFIILEVFVGFVQALVFSMLTSVFFSLAVAKH